MYLELEDGSRFSGHPFGNPSSVAGEVVFNTGMVGYPETLTDPSYKGQILILTYPLIGNYGVPNNLVIEKLDINFESNRVQIAGLIVSEVTTNHNHWNAFISLAEWLKANQVPAISGIDTRALTKLLRNKGSMMGKIESDGDLIPYYDPNRDNLVAQVSIIEPQIYGKGRKKVVLIDCGCKNNIIRCLVIRDLTVIRVPWDYDFLNLHFDGIVISNGPGNPKMCAQTVANVKRAMEKNCPIFGICLGNQILGLAAGADTYKLKFGHRSQNQPCIKNGGKHCFITSQNHGYAIDTKTLNPDWETWFTNANDGSNEGIRHRFRPFFSVQFHPEATPGPMDTNFLFDDFVKLL